MMLILRVILILVQMILKTNPAPVAGRPVSRAGCCPVVSAGAEVQWLQRGPHRSHRHPARLEGTQPQETVPAHGHRCPECGDHGQQEAEYIGAPPPRGGGQCRLRGHHPEHPGAGGQYSDQPLLPPHQEGEEADAAVNLPQGPPPIWLLEWL